MTQATHIFTAEAQTWFGRITGDLNPLHMDPEWAAVTFPGCPVVHGVHALLWGLENHLARHGEARVQGVHATFLKPIAVGDEVHVASDAGGESFRLLVRGVPMVAVRLNPAPRTRSRPFDAAVAIAPRQHACDRAFASLSDLTGIVQVPVEIDELTTAFPRVRGAAGAHAASGLAAVSTLVGMECPGLRSLLAELSVVFEPPRSPGLLAFRVRKVEPAFSRVEMDVEGAGVTGSVGAFAGRSEPPPPTAEALRALVAEQEFAGHAPLVVGASSGLGAVTARLLAAGGALPTLTWHRSPPAPGPHAISPWPGGLLRLDATAPAAGLAALAEAKWQGSQLYYFASPRIFRRRLEIYQKADLQDFLRVYVDGFHELVRGLMEMRRGAPLLVFYPSSVAVEDPASDLFEYSLAKIAGERLCERLQREHKSLRIIVRRLPRTHTRQTQTFLNVKAEAPEHVMLPIVRAVQGAA